MENKVYTKITDKIIELLNKGVVPWQRGWHRGKAPHNPYTPTFYRGINWISLIGVMEDAGYTDPRFATFKQIKDNGGSVKKGSKGTHVLYYLPVYEDGEDFEAETERKIKFLVPKAYTVFNLEAQTEGLDLPPLDIPSLDFKPLERCEQIVSGYPSAPPIKHDGLDRAFYRPSTDSIHMPVREQFKSENEYYSTLFHEMVHSTGHASRLSRAGIIAHAGFGSKSYAQEELIAEMGAAMLCADAGIEATIENSAAYIQNWLGVLNDDKTLVVRAASQAELAVKHILGE